MALYRKSRRQFRADRQRRSEVRAARWARLTAACPQLRRHLTSAQASALMCAEKLINLPNLTPEQRASWTDADEDYYRYTSVYNGYSLATLDQLAAMGLGEFARYAERGGAAASEGRQRLYLTERGRAWAKRLLELDQQTKPPVV